MFIEAADNNGKKYLRLVQSKSIVINGKRTSKKQTIYNIRPMERYDDGKANYLERLKESFKNGKPLIPELQVYCEKTPLEEYNIKLIENDLECIEHPKLFSQILIERILEELGLIRFYQQYKSLRNMNLIL